MGRLSTTKCTYLPTYLCWSALFQVQTNHKCYSNRALLIPYLF